MLKEAKLIGKKYKDQERKYCYRLKDEVRIKVKQSLHVRRTRFIYTNE